MTLIAAIRTDKGAVICADSKETHHGFYVPVDKIDTLDLGNYWGVIGGAGNEGGLIDGLAEVLADRIKAWPVGLAEVVMKDNIRFTLTDFYANEVKHFGAGDDAECIELVICVKGKTSKDVFLWRTDKTALSTIKDLALIGYRPAIYENEAKRLYGKKGKPWTARAVALGVHLLAFGKATCDWIGGDTRIVIADENNMQRYEREDAEVLEERARKFNEALADLALALPDVTVTADSFLEILGSFEKQILELRGYYLTKLAQALVPRITTGNTAIKGDLPMGTHIPIGDGLSLSIYPHAIGISDGVDPTPPSDEQKSEDQP